MTDLATLPTDPIGLAPGDDAETGDALLDVVGLARRLLFLRSAVIAQVDEGRWTVTHAADETFGLAPGASFPLQAFFPQYDATMVQPVMLPDAVKEPPSHPLPRLGRLRIRGFLAVPIVRADGTIGGALCAFDSRGRLLNARKLAILQALARVIGAEIDQQKSLAHSRRREGQARALFDDALDGMILADDEGRVLDANRAAFGLFRATSANELTGRLLIDLAPAEFPPAVDQIWAAMRAGGVGSGEVRLAQPDGPELLLEVLAQAEIEPGRHLIVFRDISERLRREERFRSLAEHSPDIIAVIDADGIQRYVSDASERILGIPPRTLIGSHVVALVHPDDEERARPFFEAIAASPGRLGSVRYRVQRQDGEWRWLETIAANKLSDPRTAGIVLTTRDVTDRKETETTERDSEAHRLAIMETALDCIVTMDGEGRITEFNPAAERTFGYRREDVVGQPLVDILVPPGLREAHNQGLANYLVTGNGPVLNKRIEVPAMRADGTELPVELAIIPLFLGGRPLFTGYLRDISERKQAEQAMAERGEALARANAELEQFAKLISRDLQRLMRVVSGYSNLLNGRYRDALDPDADASLAAAARNVGRLQERIADLIVYARIGRTSGSTELVDGEVALSMALVNLREALTQSGAAVTHDPLPTVIADLAQLSLVFQHLIDSAIRLHPHQRPRIHISAARKRDDWVFSVHDHGAELPTHSARGIVRILQGDGLESETGLAGGIGLASCRKIVELHGGRVWLDAEPGQGSALSFSLPVTPITAA